VGGFPGYEELLARLGKYKTSKGCLYLNKLADVDVSVLEEVVRGTFDATTKGEPWPVC
jgi:hypothetical protein